MGKYYKNSLKGLLTRTLVITVLVMICFISIATVFIFIYYLDIFKNQTSLWVLGMGNINSKYKLQSEAYEMANVFQGLVNDL